jgi:hypothetical protein
MSKQISVMASTELMAAGAALLMNILVACGLVGRNNTGKVALNTVISPALSVWTMAAKIP